jgi:carbamoyltransferase
MEANDGVTIAPAACMSRILGISTEPEGFSAAVVVDNRVVSGIEQFKIRQYWSPTENALLPRDAILASLKTARIDLSDLDAVAFTSASGSAEKIVPSLRDLGLSARTRVEHIDHQIAHAAAAFYVSPFNRAAILILGSGSVGHARCFLAIGEGTRIEIEETGQGHSVLPQLHRKISQALGFNNRTSNKVAWLGVSGEPEFLDVLREAKIRPDGTLSNEGPGILDLKRPHNVAASLQARIDELVIHMADDLRRRRDVPNICVAGHLAENPLLIRELEQHFGTDRVFHPPAPGIESLSIGAALAISCRAASTGSDERFVYPSIGPSFSDAQIKPELDNCKLVFNFLPCSDSLIESTCKTLAAGGLVGWFQGRCEFGHRALGFRSILANPFTPYIDENINRFLKHRESFHPFVISVPEESASEYFHQVGANARTIGSVYGVKDAHREMLAKFTVQKVWVRVHTVSAADNPLFWTLLHQTGSRTGHPLLINTSFNLPGEPLVLTPRDAIRSFYSSGLDLLAIGCFLVTK